VFHIDQQVKPAWWNQAYEAACWDAHKQWCRQLYEVLDCETEIINPFTIEPPKKILKKHIRLLKRWDGVGYSVRASVGYSVWDSVGASVGYSVRASVWASVEYSVRASVWDSVWASVGDSVGI